jgi:hypothetical protein
MKFNYHGARCTVSTAGSHREEVLLRVGRLVDTWLRNIGFLWHKGTADSAV